MARDESIYLLFVGFAIMIVSFIIIIFASGVNGVFRLGALIGIVFFLVGIAIVLFGISHSGDNSQNYDSDKQSDQRSYKSPEESTEPSASTTQNATERPKA